MFGTICLCCKLSSKRKGNIYSNTSQDQVEFTSFSLSSVLVLPYLLVTEAVSDFDSDRFFLSFVDGTNPLKSSRTKRTTKGLSTGYDFSDKRCTLTLTLIDFMSGRVPFKRTFGANLKLWTFIRLPLSLNSLPLTKSFDPESDNFIFGHT